MSQWQWIGGTRQVHVRVPYKCAPYFAEVKPDGSWEVVSHPLGLRAEGGHRDTVRAAKLAASCALNGWLAAASRACGDSAT